MITGSTQLDNVSTPINDVSTLHGCKTDLQYSPLIARDSGIRADTFHYINSILHVTNTNTCTHESYNAHIFPYTYHIPCVLTKNVSLVID